MKRLFALGCLTASIAGCQCSNPATPVTLRVKNTSADPLYVDDTDGGLGLQVQRGGSGQWRSFPEAPPCPCLACDQVCRGCNCDGRSVQPLVLKILPGENRERVWSGVALSSGNASCSSSLLQGPSCWREDNPSLDEQLQLHFCYAPSAPTIQETDAGIPVPGSLPPQSFLCVDKTFKVADGVVEISPKRGAPCTQHSDCSGTGELCFAGGCTSACPANAFPSSQIRITEPDDNGFFTVVFDGNKRTYSGMGQVGSIAYGSTTTLRMQRQVGPTTYRAAVFMSLPQGSDVALAVGETLTVKVVDASSGSGNGNGAVVIRDQQSKLLLAADSAQGAAILLPADTAPFGVVNSGKIVGCSFDSCGKRLFYSTRFTGAPTNVDLDPGKAAQLVLGDGTFQLLNFSNSDYPATTCVARKQMPYVITNCRGRPCPLAASP